MRSSTISGTYLVTNPVEAFQCLISWELFDFPIHIEEVAIFLVPNPVLFAVVASPALAPVGAVGGLAGLAGLAAIPPPPVVAGTRAAAPPVLPVAGSAPTVLARRCRPGTAPAPTPATAASAAAGAPPPTPPPAAARRAGIHAAVRRGSVRPSESWMSLRRAKTQEPTSRGASRGARGRRGGRGRGEGADPDATASAGEAARACRRIHGHERRCRPGLGCVDGGASRSRVAGPLGFAGTVSKSSEQAAGLATLSDDEFGDGPSMPMLPNTWSPEARGGGDDG